MNPSASPRRKAIVVTYPDRFRRLEVEGLAEAAGYGVIEMFKQKYLFRAQYGVGSGKAEEIALSAKELEADVIIFDEQLKAVQLYNLGKLVGIEVVDREKLILEIFSKWAVTSEAKMQVSLAQLRYEMARAREKVRLAKKGEQPGFFGLGRYEVETYHRDIKRRISTLTAKLEKITRQRSLYREQRARLHTPIVSLAGYTAAGKTTLFNTLTGEAKETGLGLFTTLSTTTRSLPVDGSKVLLSDTVGFISGLPLYMIEAFKSTLEELRHAALVLLVVDVSDPPDDVSRRFMDSVMILQELKVSPSKILVVLNKVDLVSSSQVGVICKAINLVPEGFSVVSAKTGYGLDALKAKIGQRVFEYEESQIQIPVSEVAEASVELDWLKHNASLEIFPAQDGGLEVFVRGPSWIVDRVRTAFGRGRSQDG